MVLNIVGGVFLVVAIIIVVGAIKIIPQANAGIIERLGTTHVARLPVECG